MMDAMDVVLARCTRRTHNEAFKQSGISACGGPEMSAVGVALADGLNASQT